MSDFGDQLLLGCFVNLVELCFYVSAYPIVQGLIALPLVEQCPQCTIWPVKANNHYCDMSNPASKYYALWMQYVTDFSVHRDIQW